MHSPKKILAIKFRSLGDTAILTSSLEVLRKSYPKAEIHVAVTKAWAPLLENHPAIQKIYTYERHADTPSRAKAITRLAIKLREEHFDTVINFHASPSSSLLAFATGARTRSIHFHGHHHKNRFATVEIPGKGQLFPAIERDLNSLRGLGLTITDRPLPHVFLRSEELSEARSRVVVYRKPFLMVGIGASRPAKVWPIENFAEILRRWTSETGGTSFVLYGGATEQPLVDQLRSEMGANSSVLYWGGEPIRKIAALLTEASAFIGNDSGLKHLAISVGRPTLTLLGPEDPFEWHPYSATDHPYFFIPNLPCRRDADPGFPPWCGLETCTIEKHRCMTGIPVDPVWNKLREISHV